MAAISLPLISREEYLRRERRARERSEFYRGQILAMAGASRKHNRIVSNITASLGVQLKGRPCNNYSNDMRVSVRGGEYYLYPDVVATGGREDYEDDILVNPLLIIEVLSDSTEACDRGEKFHSYQSIPSVREYVLVSRAPRRFEVFRKQDDGTWVYQSCPSPIAPLTLHSINCVLLADEVYEKVEESTPKTGD